MYNYHAQYQALEYANAMLPIPSGYPLRQGLPESFREDFAELCELIQKMYADMAEHPLEYGVMLLDISVQVEKTYSGELLDSHHSIRRLVDVLYVLFTCGIEKEGILTIPIDEFKIAIRTKRKDNLTNRVSKYQLILDKLLEFGFALEGYTQNGFPKGLDTFSLTYPTNPQIITTLKQYCDCRYTLDELEQNPLIANSHFDECFYTFDYKFTASLDALPAIYWVQDMVYGRDAWFHEFHITLYQHLSTYQNIRFNGDYYYGKTRIVRFQYEDPWKRSIPVLTNETYKQIVLQDKTICAMLNLKLKKRTDYAPLLDVLPPHLLDYMKQKTCQHCDAYNHISTKKDGYCPFQIRFMHDGTQYLSCSFHCFNFETPETNDIPIFIKLLEIDYKLKRK